MNNLRRCFENLSEALEEREYDVASREKDLEAEKEDVKRNLEVIEQDLRYLKRLEEWKSTDLEKAEKLYEEMKNSVREKESELEGLRASLSEALSELVSVQKSVVERSREAESKAEELDSAERQLREFEGANELYEKRMGEVKKEVKMKSDELMRIKISIGECDQTMKAKEKSLGLVQRNIELWSHELNIQRKKLVWVKESGEMMTKSIDQYFVDLEFKERRIEKLLEQIEEAELKLNDMCLVLEKVDEKSAEIERNEKSFASLELFKEFQIKEKVNGKNVSGFESRKNELVSKARLNELLVGSATIKAEPREAEQTPLTPRASRAICSVEKAPFEHVQELIERGEIIHAVGHILELKLTDKFSPVNLLTDYFHDSADIMKLVCDGENHDAKIKAMNQGMAIFRATIDCFKENNLPISIEKLMKRVGVLEEHLARPIGTKANPLKNNNKNKYSKVSEATNDLRKHTRSQRHY